MPGEQKNISPKPEYIVIGVGVAVVIAIILGIIIALSGGGEKKCANYSSKIATGLPLGKTGCRCLDGYVPNLKGTECVKEELCGYNKILDLKTLECVINDNTTTVDITKPTIFNRANFNGEIIVKESFGISEIPDPNFKIKSVYRKRISIAEDSEDKNYLKIVQLVKFNDIATAPLLVETIIVHPMSVFPFQTKKDNFDKELSTRTIYIERIKGLPNMLDNFTVNPTNANYLNPDNVITFYGENYTMTAKQYNAVTTVDLTTDPNHVLLGKFVSIYYPARAAITDASGNVISPATKQEYPESIWVPEDKYVILTTNNDTTQEFMFYLLGNRSHPRISYCMRNLTDFHFQANYMLIFNTKESYTSYINTNLIQKINEVKTTD